MPGDLSLPTFVELERGVWDALRRGDAEADARLLADDFVGVYPTGFAGRSDHVGQLSNGPTVTDFELYDARVVVLSDDVVLLSYRAEWHRTGGTPESTYISSLWCRRGGEWVNVFSQDTPSVSPRG